MKVRAIFKWICSNIRFDTEAFWEDKPTYTEPKDIIKHKVTVAKGYANLFSALAKKANLQVFTILIIPSITTKICKLFLVQSKFAVGGH